MDCGTTWRCYDSIASRYDHDAVELVFAAPARDLAALVGLPAGGRLLDVGTGTGRAALAAGEIGGPGSELFGIDLSVEMLRQARRRGLSGLAAAAATALPFPDSVFERVVASFVLAHCACYRSALGEMVGVLRRGGRLGVTVWSGGVGEAGRCWQQAAEEAVGKEVLSRAIQQALPWEDWLADPTHLQDALAEAGLVDVTVQQRQYTATMTVAKFLAFREVSLQARFVRERLGEAGWERFRAGVAERLGARLDGPVLYARGALVAAGTRT